MAWQGNRDLSTGGALGLSEQVAELARRDMRIGSRARARFQAALLCLRPRVYPHS